MSQVMDWNDGWGAGTWLVMILMMLVFWGGLIAVIVLAVRGSLRPARPTDTRGPEPDADELLAERYARGEIDEDEYRRRREVLRDRRPTQI
jgi:putative membrane protein